MPLEQIESFYSNFESQFLNHQTGAAFDGPVEDGISTDFLSCVGRPRVVKISPGQYVLNIPAHDNGALKRHPQLYRLLNELVHVVLQVIHASNSVLSTSPYDPQAEGSLEQAAADKKVVMSNLTATGLLDLLEAKRKQLLCILEPWFSLRQAGMIKRAKRTDRWDEIAKAAATRMAKTQSK